MAKINCAVEKCVAVLEVFEPVSPSVRFICKNHPRAVQVRAAGRKYDPVKDEADKALRFQEHAFDKDLKRSAKAIGTGHIHRQGAETDDQPEGCGNVDGGL